MNTDVKQAGAGQAGAEAATVSRRAWAILAIVLVADIMDLLDSTITTIAAPTIAARLHGGPGLIKWLGASYALALGVLLVTGGRLGDRFGRRRTFLIGIAGFTMASLACGLAWDPASIIVARLAQGAFGALLIPQGFGILGSVFPREAIGKAFSAFGPVLGLSAVGGPLLAAALIDANLFGLGWRPMFLINIVLGVAGLAAAVRLLPRDRGDAAVTVDVAGAALLAGCMLGLLDGLIQGSTDGWTAVPVVALTVGVACFAGFCQRQRTAAAPLIKPSLLRNRGFTAGLVMGVIFFAAVAGLVYAVSLFLQRGLGDSPLRAAVTGFAPMAAGIVLASVICMNLISRLGRTLSLAGIAVSVAGTGALLAIVAHAGTSAAGLTGVTTAVLAPAMAVIGLGMGAAFGTLYDIAIGDIDPAEAGSASGSLSSVQQLANALGPAIVTTIYFGAQAGGEAHAMTVSLLAVIGIGVVSALAVPLLPRKPQSAAGH
jgi:EmrB/QacA subfamily drug resistance transporter